MAERRASGVAAQAAGGASNLVPRELIVRFRARAQQLDAVPGSAPPRDVGLLDVGVQDTGPDGAGWALALRGADVARDPGLPDDIAIAWTLRVAPHAYRSADLAMVARTVRPLSRADAASRLFDASKPLKAAGIDAGTALAQAAMAMREIVTEPMGKGTVSTAMTAALPEPFRRWCRPCQATHLYEQPFRLAALYAGVTLEPGTSPPVLRPLDGWDAGVIESLRGLPETAPEDGECDGDALIARLLHVLGPMSARNLATFLDAPVRDITSRIAALTRAGTVVEVGVEGVGGGAPSRASLLADDLDDLLGGDHDDRRDDSAVRLLGPYDLFLQGRDRSLLVPDTTRHKALWPVLGRPGAVLDGGEIVGTWRPRTSGRTLRVLVEPWAAWSTARETAVDEECERLAAYRGVTYGGRASGGDAPS